MFMNGSNEWGGESKRLVGEGPVVEYLRTVMRSIE